MTDTAFLSFFEMCKKSIDGRRMCCFLHLNLIPSIQRNYAQLIGFVSTKACWKHKQHDNCRHSAWHSYIVSSFIKLLQWRCKRWKAHSVQAHTSKSHNGGFATSHLGSIIQQHNALQLHKFVYAKFVSHQNSKMLTFCPCVDMTPYWHQFQELMQEHETCTRLRQEMLQQGCLCVCLDQRAIVQMLPITDFYWKDVVENIKTAWQCTF